MKASSGAYHTGELPEAFLALAVSVQQVAPLKHRAAFRGNGKSPVGPSPEVAGQKQHLVGDAADGGGLAGGPSAGAGVTHGDLIVD